MGALVVLTTVSGAKAADRLARRTVQEKKAACVSVLPSVVSHYRWKGKIRRTRESLLFIKTTRAAWPDLLKFLEKNHPYKIPEVLALPATRGSKTYLSWLKSTCLILCLVLVGIASGSHLSWAKETFVKYSEAQKNFATAPQATESVTVDELREIQEMDPKALVFDARSREEFNKQHIAGSLLPMPDDHYTQEALFRQKIVRTSPDEVADLSRGTASLAKNATIVTYCNRNCGLSKGLMKQLKTLGFTNVRYLAGGIDSWREKGYPLEAQGS
jgi:periplasmic divalent cation tolerance protein